MRWRNLEISVLSILALSSLDSNKDAHFVCVASRCQGRPLGWPYAMELAEETALAERIITKQVLPVYGRPVGMAWKASGFLYHRSRG